MDDKDTFEKIFFGVSHVASVMLRHCPWTVTLMIFHIDQAGTPRPRGPLELVGIGRSLFLWEIEPGAGGHQWTPGSCIGILADLVLYLYRIPQKLRMSPMSQEE
jgi:hypothetical protein